MPYGIQKPINKNLKKESRTGAISGFNQNQLEQFLDPSQALIVKGYFQYLEGKLEKLKGSKSRASTTGAAPKSFVQFTSDLFLLGFGTTLSVFSKSANTITAIKTNFSANVTSIAVYGGYAFVATGKQGERIYRISRTLDYDGQTANFTVGATLTGATSGATATILEDADGGATGTLTLKDVTGTFANNEVLADNGGTPGAAVANLTINWVATLISAAPRAEGLFVDLQDARLIAFDCGDADVYAAKQDLSGVDPAVVNPPFTDWTLDDVGGAAYKYPTGDLGHVNSIAQLPNQGQEGLPSVNVAFCQRGWAAFFVTIDSSSGVAVQRIVTKFFNNTHGGGKRGSLATDLGIFFANPNGIFLLMADSNVVNLTDSFGSALIEQLNFDDFDAVYLPQKNQLIVTCSKQATVNNKVYILNTLTIALPRKAWFERSGLSISRFLLDDRTVYGLSSSSPRVLELFPDNVWDDQGVGVEYHYEQMVTWKDLSSVKDFLSLEIGGYFSLTNPVTIEILGVNENGERVSTGIQYTIQSAGAEGELAAYDEAIYGESAYSITPAPSGTGWVEKIGNLKAYNYKYYILKIQGIDIYPHIISYTLMTGAIGRQQRNQLTIA